MLVNISAEDSISRYVIFSVNFDGDIHTDSMLFPISGRKDDGFYHWSGILRSLAKSDEQVHNIGCATAATQNKNRQDPPSGPTRRYYCGFRTAIANDLDLTFDDCILEIENDHDQQVDIRIMVAIKGTSAMATARTNVLLAIAEVFTEHSPHVCEIDRLDAEHPLNKFGINCLLPSANAP
jgi:hypothetical protein